MRTIYGTNGRDFLIGSKRPTEVFAGRGDDWLGDIGRQWGPATSDIFHGGGGDDFLFTFGGKDKVFGDAGNDTLFANTRDSFEFDGGKGWDRLEVTFADNIGLAKGYVNDELIFIKLGKQVVHLDDVEEVVVRYLDEGHI